MKLQEFYEALVPDEGVRVIARQCEGEKDGRKFTYFKHLLCDDVEQMKKATAAIAKGGSNVYYALASFQQGFHPNPKTGKQQVRVRDNVHKLKALWFDIDFKGGLSNPTEVVAALREFCNGTRMPAPSILVHSGNGIHVYWPFTYSIPASEWQQLADGLKSAASGAGLAVDLPCTADAARVLRPIGSANYKDPTNPKVVRPLFASGKLHDPVELRRLLVTSSPEGINAPVPEYLQRGAVVTGGNEELSGGVTAKRTVESFVANIAKKCKVVAHHLETGGADASEPEWKDVLQLAKHATDGGLYVHALSQGHPDYTADDTNEKWQQRLENEAGPTLCDTFAGHRPEICAACPHRHKIKTPLSLGEEQVVAFDGKEFPLKTWRPVEGNMGMERKMFDKTSKEYFWEKVLGRSWELVGASRDIISGKNTMTIISRLGKADAIELEIPSTLLGDTTGLKKELATYGATLLQNEVTHWIALMKTWHETIQQKRQIGDSVSRLGWIEVRDPDTNEIDVKGFTAGDASYLSNGQAKKGLRIATEYREAARNFLPVGSRDRWQDAADFICAQNNPAFTAVLASAFAAPIFGFTGMPGAMLTIVSTASGVGKTSVMKTAQAVWGNPVRGMNSTSDTYLSIIRKVAFLKNLPVYWDEIRGENAMEAFYKTAFDIAQGKERTRLNANAEMREVNDWKTLVIGASNESIFDYMGQAGGQSDAAVARTFEIEVQPFDDPERASRNAMFGMLDNNYGHAGQVFAEFISTKQPQIEQTIRTAYESIYKDWGMHEGERFWAAIAATLLVAAGLAKHAGLVDIDTKTLKAYLRDRLTVLRTKTSNALAGVSARELLVAYIQAHQNLLMIVDHIPAPGQRKDVAVLRPPKEKLLIVKCDNTYRFTQHDFSKWLRTSHNISYSSIEEQMEKECSLSRVRAVLGAKTQYALPRARVLEVTLNND